MSIGPARLGVVVDEELPLPPLLPHASRKAVSAVPERPTAPARFRKSRRLCGENKLPNSLCSWLLIRGYLHVLNGVKRLVRTHFIDDIIMDSSASTRYR